VNGHAVGCRSAVLERDHDVAGVGYGSAGRDAQTFSPPELTAEGVTGEAFTDEDEHVRGGSSQGTCGERVAVHRRARKWWQIDGGTLGAGKHPTAGIANAQRFRTGQRSDGAQYGVERFRQV
jgi:hypothetical protein